MISRNQNHRPSTSRLEIGSLTKLIVLVLLVLGISWFMIHPIVLNQLHSFPSKKILRTEPNSPPQSLFIPQTPQPTLTVTPTQTPTLPATPSPAKLHAVTYASHHGRDDRFCRAVESAVRNQYQLVILGWTVPWKGLAQKLDAAYKYAQSIPDDDLMLFTDAFDVLFTEESQHIVDIFLKRNYKILFAGECGCWPHIVEDPKACFSGYPMAPTPYRYLNSGTWIGIAKYARAMLLDVIQSAGNNFISANDQKLVADMFIAQKHPIALDYYAEIFQSMHSTDPPDLPLCHPFPDLKLQNLKWSNQRTNTTPAVFHFNGGGKVHHLPMEGKMWYKQRRFYQGERRRALETARIQTPGYEDGSISYRELCVDYLRTLH